MTSKSQSALTIRLPVWRARLLVTLMFLGFMALAARALYCQSVNKDFLQAEAEKRYSRTTTLIATRGLITDRNGEALAISTAVETVSANPSHLELDNIPHEKLLQLSKLLSMDVKVIHRKLSEKKQYVLLKRQKKLSFIKRAHLKCLVLQSHHRMKKLHFIRGVRMALQNFIRIG